VAAAFRAIGPNLMSVANLSSARRSCGRRYHAFACRALAAPTSIARTSSVIRGSSSRCLLIVRIEIPSRIRAMTISEWRWRRPRDSRLSTAALTDGSDWRARKRCIRIQGTHCCQRAAIARSNWEGKYGPADGLGVQGSIVRRTLSLCRTIAPMYHTSRRWLRAHSCSCRERIPA
jgi:hypothetical protein